MNWLPFRSLILALATKKRRPILVLTNPDRRGDFMGLSITSVLTEEFAVAIDEESMSDGHLPKTSWIRYDKVFTLIFKGFLRILRKATGSLWAGQEKKGNNGVKEELWMN